MNQLQKRDQDLQVLSRELGGVKAALVQAFGGEDKSSDKLARRLIQSAMLALQKSDYLLSVAMKNPQSLREAVKDAAESGLDIGGVRQHGALVPYGGGNPKVQFQPQYQGYIHLMTSGENAAIRSIASAVVREADKFRHWIDEKGEHIEYEKANVTGRGQITGAFAVAYFKGGGCQLEHMDFGELEAIRKRSKAVQSGKTSPWDTDPEAMYRKCPIRRLRKYVPLTNAVVERLVEQDVEGGGEVIEVESIIVEELERGPTMPAAVAAPVKARPKPKAKPRAAPKRAATPPAPPPEPQDPPPVEVQSQPTADPEKAAMIAEARRLEQAIGAESAAIVSKHHGGGVTVQSTVEEISNYLFDCKELAGEVS